MPFPFNHGCVIQLRKEDVVSVIEMWAVKRVYFLKLTFRK